MCDVLLNQTVIPDYRFPLFRELKRRQGQRLTFSCGDAGFVPALQTCNDARALARPVRNCFFLRRNLLWQRDFTSLALGARLLITEFNLRAVSTWVVLARRAWLGKPSVMWGHAQGQRPGMAFLKRWMFRRTSGFIAYTNQQRNQLASEFPGLPIWTAPNAMLWQADCYSPPRPAAAVCHVLYVGRLVPGKKPALLAEGFLKAVSQGGLPAETRLVVVGDGPERAKIADLFAKAGLCDRLRLLGHVSEVEKLRNLYAESLVSVSPGYVGLSATQSFAFGVPMLVADDEPHSPEIEACRAGHTCRFFSAGNASDLAQRLAGFFSEKEFWLSRRKALSEWTQANYSFERMAETLEAVIEYFVPLAKTDYSDLS